MPCSQQGLPAGALSSHPHTWRSRLRQRIKPISPSPPTLGKLRDRRMKEVCVLPATHVLSKFTARQSLLFVLAPPSLPAIHALRDFISSKWRLEREESKQEKEEEKKNLEGRQEKKATTRIRAKTQPHCPSDNSLKMICRLCGGDAASKDLPFPVQWAASQPVPARSVWEPMVITPALILPYRGQTEGFPILIPSCLEERSSQA